MENIIESRAILGVLCFIHVIVIYAAQCPWGHIKRKVLDGIILTELVSVTAYIIYDNLQTPPYDGWFLAILGYIVVYGLIFMTWIMYNIFTFLDKNKIYEMTITRHIHFMNKDYLEGSIFEEESKINVLLPYSAELDPATKDKLKQNVKFDNILQGCILVKRV